MIIGVGIDILEVDRVKKVVERNLRFLNRVFTENETQYSLPKKNKYQHLAARFAAKEAFFKAIGKRISWTEVEVVNEPSGQPRLLVHAKEDLGFTRCHLSLSHLAEHALAVVVLEKD
jgi:phosphopantetheine--protein transferase-like protein